MCKYNTQMKILRELFNTPPEEPPLDIYYSPSLDIYYYSPLIQIIRSWVNNKMWDLLPKQKVEEKNPALKSQEWEIANTLVNMLKYATPSLQVKFSSPSRNQRPNIIPSNMRDNLVESLEYITTFPNEDWDKLFVPIFEDFIKIMKSFKYFNMEALSDFLATNELHDLWLIVATNKDYSDESADRFSL